MLSLMAFASLKLFDFISYKQIEYAIAVRAAKTAVFYKIIKGGMAGGAGYADPLSGLLLVVLNSQKAGQELPQRKFSVQNSAVLSQIHLSGTLGAEIMLRPNTVYYF